MPDRKILETTAEYREIWRRAEGTKVSKDRPRHVFRNFKRRSCLKGAPAWRYLSGNTLGLPLIIQLALGLAVTNSHSKCQKIKGPVLLLVQALPGQRERFANALTAANPCVERSRRPQHFGIGSSALGLARTPTPTKTSLANTLLGSCSPNNSGVMRRSRMTPLELRNVATSSPHRACLISPCNRAESFIK